MPRLDVRRQPQDVRPALRAPGRTWRGAAAVYLVLTQTVGCYASLPVNEAPQPGTTLLLDLTDQGRVALGPKLGQSAERIQGDLQAVSDTGYTLRVASVRYINGQIQQWTGESFTVPVGFVSRTRRQEFSRFRTFALAGGIAAAIVVGLMKANIIGGAGGSHDRPNPPPPGGS
jgi:hypothetical protein